MVDNAEEALPSTTNEEEEEEEEERKEDGPSLTNAQARQFDMLRPMIDAAYREMGELSKKKQEGIVNER